MAVLRLHYAGCRQQVPPRPFRCLEPWRDDQGRIRLTARTTYGAPGSRDGVVDRGGVPFEERFELRDERVAVLVVVREGDRDEAAARDPEPGEQHLEVEEVVGGAVRLEETEAIINRRDSKADLDQLRKRRTNPTGFHRGTTATWGCYTEQDRFHCIFVKTLAYLTDVGPDDGGTCLIPGSHRLTWPREEMIRAATDDERLIHQVEARAGSVLLFGESLIHSTTAIRSDRERVILVAGYTPPMLREWMGNEVSPGFIATLPQEMRPLISGSDSWNWRRNYTQ